MKALVYYEPSKKSYIFEGDRLRKTIKGALELNDVEHTSNLIDAFNVVHLISPEDEKVLLDAKEYKIPVVVSALYTEDDPNASYLEEIVTDNNKLTILKPKAIKFLNEADLVLVPCEEAKQLFIDKGITTNIKVSSLGLNLSRFDFSRDDEKEIFYRYFREDKNKRLVLAIGEYNSIDGVTAIINAAKKNPETLFYYLGRDEKAKRGLKVKHIIKNAPANLKFKGVLPDDVYRSALMNADVFMLTGYKTSGTLSIAEAMAAKCQIIVRKTTMFEELIKNKETGYVAEYSETLTSLVDEYLKGDIQPTIANAYTEAHKHNLTTFGKELIEQYNLLLENK